MKIFLFHSYTILSSSIPSSSIFLLSYPIFYSTSNPISYLTFYPILSSTPSYPILSFFLSIPLHPIFYLILSYFLSPSLPFYPIYPILSEPTRSHPSYNPMYPLELRKLKKKIQLKIAVIKGKYFR